MWFAAICLLLCLLAPRAQALPTGWLDQITAGSPSISYFEVPSIFPGYTNVYVTVTNGGGVNAGFNLFTGAEVAASVGATYETEVVAHRFSGPISRFGVGYHRFDASHVYLGESDTDFATIGHAANKSGIPGTPITLTRLPHSFTMPSGTAFVRPRIAITNILPGTSFTFAVLAYKHSAKTAYGGGVPGGGGGGGGGGGTTLTATLNITSANNGQTFDNYHISTTSGDCVNISGATSVIFQNSTVGPCAGQGVNIDGSNNINIFDSYIHTDATGAACCDTRDGVKVNNSSFVNLQGNVVAYSETNIRVQGGSHDITVDGNYSLNPRGPPPRGQHFQADTASNLTITNNRALVRAGFLFPSNQDEAFNFFNADVVTVSNNYIEGGTSPTGMGIIARNGSDNQNYFNNTLYNTGQGGISIASGQNQQVSGNKILNLTPIAGGGNTGISVWNQHAPTACGNVSVRDNIVSQIQSPIPCNPETQACTFSGFFDGGGCGTVTQSGNTFDQGSYATTTAASYGPKAGVTAPAGAIIINPGTNIQAAVNAAATGATFFLSAGVHRLGGVTNVHIQPKANQKFIGAQGAVLSGARLLTGWTFDGTNWWVGGQTQEFPRVQTGVGEAGSQRSGFTETVSFNNVAFRPVDALSKLTNNFFFFDYGADRIYIRNNPTGQTVEASISQHAFQRGVSGVTVQNLIVEKYSSPVQQGAINGGPGWIIRDNEVRLSYGIGISQQDNSQAIGNYVHDNGQMGFGGNGANILVEGNRISYNGRWSGIDPYWEAGGSKWALTTNLIVRGNWSHNNHAVGLWTDIDNYLAIYENNVLQDNDGAGISHEISYNCIMRNNVFQNNGPSQGWFFGGAIQLQNSGGCEVYGNKIVATAKGLNNPPAGLDAHGGHGIQFIQQERGSGNRGQYNCVNNNIHDNITVATTADGPGVHVGAVCDIGLANCTARMGGNLWRNNQYFMTDGSRFDCGYRISQSTNFATWKSNCGETGTISQAFPDTSQWVSQALGGGGSSNSASAPAYSALKGAVPTGEPPIPPRPRNCIANSPYSTQTGFPSCN